MGCSLVTPGPPGAASPATYPTASTAMNVQQLIEQLQKYPPGLRVIRKGYERGFDDLSKVELTQIIVDCNAGMGWWNGNHAHPSQTLPPTAIGDEQALLIT